jgi:AcrR family transcriptional regulator
MPLPRFEKLPKEKQERILEAAVKVFTAQGYEKASLNLMLEGAGISKGAAYYYFADKADLIGTVVRRYWLESFASTDTAFATLTTEEFWETIAALYLHPFGEVERRPWLLGLSRAVWDLPRDLARREPFKSVIEEAGDWMAALIRRGRELGLVREDLPEDLLVELIQSLDGVHDRWLSVHWQDMTLEERHRTTELFVSFLKKILAPPDCGGEEPK